MAKLKKEILCSLIFLLIIGSFFLPKNQFQKAKEKLLKNPYDAESQLILAEEFLKNNQFEELEKILRLNPNLDEIREKKHYSDPKDVKQLIIGWEKILKEKPDYRDAWLQLTVLYYKLYQNEKAKECLAKALEFDPNYEPARNLKRYLN